MPKPKQNSGNRTPNRYTGGRPPNKVVIAAREGAALRKLLETRHGYSPEEAIAGLLSGELATVLLPDEHRYALARWLAAGLPGEGLDEVRGALMDVIEQVAANEGDTAMEQIEGSVTRAKLAAWIEVHRPELGIDEQSGTKGFYRLSEGQAWSFQGQGETWRDVAAALGAITVQDDA